MLELDCKNCKTNIVLEITIESVIELARRVGVYCELCYELEN